LLSSFFFFLCGISYVRPVVGYLFKLIAASDTYFTWASSGLGVGV